MDVPNGIRSVGICCIRCQPIIMHSTCSGENIAVPLGNNVSLSPPALSGPCGWPNKKPGRGSRFWRLAAFRIAATGERRKKGALLAPMHPRAPGERVRKTPGLAVVYDSEGLPATTPSEKLPAGERSVAMNLESLPDQLQAVRCRTSHRRNPKNPLDQPAIAKPNKPEPNTHGAGGQSV